MIRLSSHANGTTPPQEKKHNAGHWTDTKRRNRPAKAQRPTQGEKNTLRHWHNSNTCAKLLCNLCQKFAHEEITKLATCTISIRIRGTGTATTCSSKRATNSSVTCANGTPTICPQLLSEIYSCRNQLTTSALSFKLRGPGTATTRSATRRCTRSCGRTLADRDRRRREPDGTREGGDPRSTKKRERI